MSWAPSPIDCALLELGILRDEALQRGADLSVAGARWYQRHVGLEADGIVGPITRSALAADLIRGSVPALEGFRGSLGLLIQWEGHAGRPYWPGASSGVTLDPGFDLRFHPPAELCALYSRTLPEEALTALSRACGASPEQARELLLDPEIARIRISRDAAAVLLPKIAGPYWSGAVRAASHLRAAPRRVQTAVLSYVYNLGLDDLRALQSEILRRDWAALASLVEHDSRLPDRRAAEAALIRSATEDPSP